VRRPDRGNVGLTPTPAARLLAGSAVLHRPGPQGAVHRLDTLAQAARAAGTRAGGRMPPADLLPGMSRRDLEALKVDSRCAPRPRLERGTYCLGGTFEVWPGSAGCSLTCRLAAVAMAGYGLAWPSACSRWLPVWLPGIVGNAEVRMLGTLMRSQDRKVPPGSRALPSENAGQDHAAARSHSATCRATRPGVSGRIRRRITSSSNQKSVAD
jgi:hypothetical protein